MGWTLGFLSFCDSPDLPLGQGGQANVGANLNGGGSTTLETPINRRIFDPNATKGAVLPNDASKTLVDNILNCLLESDPKLCLSQLDLGLITPEEIGEVLATAGIPRLSKITFLAEVLVKCEPGEAATLMDTVCQILGGDPSDHFAWFEAAISRVEVEYSFWLEDFITAITPDEIFYDNGTDLMPLIFWKIQVETPRVDQMILEGGMGQWGGTPEQIERAFVVTMAAFSESNPIDCFEYSYEALNSPFLTADDAKPLAQNSLFFAGIMGQNGEAEPEEVEALLSFLLSDIRFQRAAAAQFFEETRTSATFGGLDESTFSSLSFRAREIIEMPR